MGSRAEYAAWIRRAERFLRENGDDPASLDRVDATVNYRSNRVILFALADPRDDLSATETLAHEVVHALLEYLGERWAARTLDRIARRVGDPGRTGGI